MREKINLLARGQIEYELPRLMMNPERLLLHVEAGKKAHATANLKNSAERYLKGFVSSDSQDIEIMNKNISGVDITVELVVHGECAEAGDVLEGELSFVTNCGEIWLPYRVEIVAPTLLSSEGSIGDMKQFSNLARGHFAEAVRLFSETEFEHFLSYHEPESLYFYEHFMKSTEKERALEEFLIATGRKMAVTIEADLTELKYEIGREEVTDHITLYKDNWGYTTARVTCKEPFLQMGRETVGTEQFVGHTCEIGFRIHPEHMHEGNNQATITVETTTRQIAIHVTCHKAHENPQAVAVEREQNELLIRMTECYLSYRMNRIPESRYISEMESLFSKVAHYYPEGSPVVQLASVKLLRLGGQESQANAILRSISEADVRSMGVMVRATYLYLKAERAQGNKAELMQELYQISNEHHEFPEPALFLMKLDERYSRNQKLKLDELRGIFDNGCQSPVVYLEAMLILNENPALLHDLGEFELQTIAFGMKRKMISRELAHQFSYLVERSREYRPIYYTILSGLYDRFGLTETLAAICQILIKAGLKDKCYGIWYRRGVEEQLHVAELYEYYMYTAELDLETTLDPDVLMYFAYNSKLSEKRLAYLYANIVLHKESDRGTYETFLNRITEYTMEQIREGKNNRYLAVLYSDCLTNRDTETETLAYLSRVCFRHEIVCHNPQIRYVCVSHPQLSEEVVTPLVNGVAQIEIFSEDALVSFMDDFGNRFVGGIEFENRKFLSAEEYYTEAYKRSPESKRLLLHLTRKAQNEGRMDQTVAPLKRTAMKFTELSDRYRNELICSLVLYYYDNFEDEMLEDYLLELDLDSIPKKHRGKLINLMILRGQLERSIMMLADYGYDGVDSKLIERMAASLSLDQKATYQKQLLPILTYAYSAGRRNERLVAFLVDNFQGSTMQTYQLWQDARNLGLNVDELGERVLSQMLFTESYLNMADEVFRYYQKPGCSRQAVRAYLTYVSYKYLISDIPIGEYTMAFLKKDLRNDENDICALALLRYLSEQDDLDADDRAAAEYWLLRMDAKGKVMPCFLKLSKYFKLPDGLEDKCLIEYRTNPRHKVTLHYIYRVGGKRKQKDMPMRNICYGIFVKELVLFVGEHIEYAISDEDEDKTFVSDRVALEKTIDEIDEDSQFGQINAIIAARQNKDKNKAIALLNEYVKNKFATEQLFHEIQEDEG